MNKDLNYFIGELNQILDTVDGPSEGPGASMKIRRVLFDAKAALNEDDYKRLGQTLLEHVDDLQVQRFRHEIGLETARYIAGELARFGVQAVRDLPSFARDEVFERVQVEMAVGAPGLEILYDADGNPVDVQADPRLGDLDGPRLGE